VENNTDQVIWLIHFRAALLRPGYEEPWLVKEFAQLVLNGLAPGTKPALSLLCAVMEAA